MLTKDVKFWILADLRFISHRIEVLEINETLHEEISRIYRRAKHLKYYLRRTLNESEAPILFNNVTNICDTLLALTRINCDGVTNTDDASSIRRIFQIQSCVRKAQEELFYPSTNEEPPMDK